MKNIRTVLWCLGRAFLASFVCWFAIDTVYHMYPEYYVHDIHDIFVACAGAVGVLTYIWLDRKREVK